MTYPTRDGTPSFKIQRETGNRMICRFGGVIAMEPNNQETKANEAVYLWVLSLSVGLAIGAGIGVVIGHIGAGIAVGVGVGVAVGLFLYRRSTTISSDD